MVVLYIHLEITRIQGIIILSSTFCYLMDINMTGNLSDYSCSTTVYPRRNFFTTDFLNTLLNFNISVRLVFMHFGMLY